ncbi:MAG: serine protease, partial [Solirubrobacteraceae bacterium]|nr:serine protease [Solirubrobacteraceae bacterium]
MPSPRLIIGLLLAVLLGTAQAAPAATPQPRIINGVNAAPGAWPAQASVRVDVGGGFTSDCGGTLVSARWVLTAAHCVHDDSTFVIFSPAAFLPVRIGSISRFSGGAERAVAAVQRHPSFSQAPDGVPNYDLALLQLTAKVPADVEPMPMIRPDASEAGFWSPGTAATVVGWGDTETGSDSDTQLKQGQVPIVSDGNCGWSGLFNSASMFCAGRLDVDTCSGDSGGPIAVPRFGVFTLLGVTSWGTNPCATPGVAGVYARLGAPAVGN